MARTPSMSPAECEAILGPRGRLFVTAENVHSARKWLTANGVPGLYAAGLARAAIAAIYNDTSGVQLDKAKAKAREADDSADVSAHELNGELVAAQGAQSDAQAFGVVGAADSAKTVEMAQASKQANVQGDMQRIAAVVAAVMASMPSVGVDEIAVKRIVDSALNGRTLSADEIRKLVEQEAPKHVQVTRIEVKAQDSDSFQVLDGIHHPQFDKLLRAACSRQPDGFHPNIWISGPAGSGKTYAAKMVAKAMELDFFYNGALGMSHELLGFIDAGGTYHPTPFFKGYTGKALHLYDEVDGSDNSALLAVNAALANGTASFPHGMFERHKDSVIIATANTWGLGATADYVGRAKIDAAFLSRFPVRIQWDYDTDMESAISGNPAFAKRVQQARAKARAAGIKVLIDPRASIAGSALIAAGFNSDDAAGMTYLANLTPEQRRMIEG